MNYERRMTAQKMKTVDGTLKLEGYAAVFDQLSDDLGGFREKIDRGAFAETIRKDDIRALFNHDPNFVLGRTTAGTLRLEEDDYGLKIDVDMPDTEWSRGLRELIKRGDVSQMSFGFINKKDEWNESDSKNVIRTLKQVKLLDISPVTFPAYPQTDVSVRSNAYVKHLESQAARDVVSVMQKKLRTKEKTWK